MTCSYGTLPDDTAQGIHRRYLKSDQAEINRKTKVVKLKKRASRTSGIHIRTQRPKGRNKKYRMYPSKKAVTKRKSQRPTRVMPNPCRRCRDKRAVDGMEEHSSMGIPARHSGRKRLCKDASDKTSKEASQRPFKPPKGVVRASCTIRGDLSLRTSYR